MAGDPTVWHVVVSISKNLPNYIHLQSYSCTFMKVYEGTGTAVVLINNHSTQYSTSIIRNFNYIQISSNRQIQWKSGFAIRIRAIYLLWKRLGLIVWYFRKIGKPYFPWETAEKRLDLKSLKGRKKAEELRRPAPQFLSLLPPLKALYVEPFLSRFSRKTAEPRVRPK